MQAALGVLAPKKPKQPAQDTALIDQQKKDLADREAKNKEESERLRGEANDRLTRNRRARLSKSSLISGLESGVDTKREVLG